MKEFRKGKGCTEHYTSLAELREAFGLKKLTKRTKDKKKLESQKDKILGVCPYCKTKLNYNGGNVLTCANDKCKGRKVETVLSDGTIDVKYYPYYKLLNDKGSMIAQNLFSE